MKHDPSAPLLADEGSKETVTEERVAAPPNVARAGSHATDVSEAELPEGVRSVLDGAESVARSVPASAQTAGLPVASSAPLGLVIGRVLAVREGDVDLLLGGDIVAARRFGALHASVLATAQRTGEPVIAQRNADGSYEVMGALRTQPTPGVDDMREIVLEADRVELRGRKEVALTTSGIAAIALRAAGEVETYADRIVSRAEELHKIVGRMLRLN
jgi:hypothetical protein